MGCQTCFGSAFDALCADATGSRPAASLFAATALLARPRFAAPTTGSPRRTAPLLCASLGSSSRCRSSLDRRRCLGDIRFSDEDANLGPPLSPARKVGLDLLAALLRQYAPSDEAEQLALVIGYAIGRVEPLQIRSAHVDETFHRVGGPDGQFQEGPMRVRVHVGLGWG